MTEKRPVGRPRKNPRLASQQATIDAIETPDCEPATKGFVKCIARKTSTHTHPIDCEELHAVIVLTNSSVILCLGVILAYASGATGAAIVIGGVTCLCIMFVYVINDRRRYEQTGGVEVCGSTYEAIQKYEPPKCEEKKECE